MKTKNKENLGVAARVLVVLALAVGLSDRLLAENADAPGVAGVDSTMGRNVAAIPLDPMPYRNSVTQWRY
jgi:hypothetical protein